MSIPLAQICRQESAEGRPELHPQDVSGDDPIESHPGTGGGEQGVRVQDPDHPADAGRRKTTQRSEEPLLWSLLRKRQAVTRSRKADATARYCSELEKAEGLCRGGDWHGAGQRLSIAILLRDVVFPGIPLSDKLIGDFIEMTTYVCAPPELRGFKF